MKNNKYVIFALLFVVTTAAFAQPGFDDTVDDVAAIPGLLLAIAAAVGIGVAKLRNKK